MWRVRFEMKGMTMKTIYKVIALSYLLILPLGNLAMSQSKINPNDIIHKLTCQCGTCPNLALYSCSCGTAERMRTEVKDLVDKGMESNEIMARFISTYGERVMATPKAEGFYLSAWGMPILLVLGFGTLIIIALKRWSSSPAGVEVPNAPGKDKVIKAYSDKLDSELDDF